MAIADGFLWYECPTPGLMVPAGWTNATVCGANAVCVDTPGSFACNCRRGYIGDGRRCTELDECAREVDNCHPRATCTNTVGSFTCACPAGFSGSGTNCTRQAADVAAQALTAGVARGWDSEWHRTQHSRAASPSLCAVSRSPVADRWLSQPWRRPWVLPSPPPSAELSAEPSAEPSAALVLGGGAGGAAGGAAGGSAGA
eukprot:2721481-Rhodomonas_salina.1